MKKMAVMVPVLGVALLGAGYAAGALLAPPLPDDAPAAETAQPDSAEIEAATEDAHGVTSTEAEPMDSYEIAQDRLVVRVGQITVPVEKPRSVAYVVTDIALKARDIEAADRLTRVENAIRIRDLLLERLHEVAEGPLLRDVSIDGEALSADLTASLQLSFPEIADVIFVALVKQDVPRI